MVKSLKWNPTECTISKMNSDDYYISFKAFRVSSSGYINKKYVKEYVFKKYNNRCNSCGSDNELHVDHIKSVHYCFLNNVKDYCNSLENLQLLCSKCNLLKSNKNE